MTEEYGNFILYQTMDCEKCGNIPCVCGWVYRNLPRESRITIAANILGASSSEIEESMEIPEKHPSYIIPRERWLKGSSEVRKGILREEVVPDLVEEFWYVLNTEEKMLALEYQDIPGIVERHWDDMPYSLKEQAALYQACPSLYDKKWDELDSNLVQNICRNRNMKTDAHSFLWSRWNDLSPELRELTKLEQNVGV